MKSDYEYDPSFTVVPAYYSGGIPVFTPTSKEFADFYKFNKAINKYGMKSGIVKIIPPKKWRQQLGDCYGEEKLRNVKIKNPIVQQINSISPGVFTLQNIEKARTFNMLQWRELGDKPSNQPPAPRGKRDVSAKKPAHIDTSQFTPERCEELEKNYWRTLTYAEPMYGADMLGSLFPDSVKSWNVASLPNILDLMDITLPGVNDAYLYAGLWKASFAWHLEDQDLYSINYLHFGAPKQWYLIPQDEAGKFFELMTDTFGDEYKACPEFLRHKTFMVSPQFLEKHDVRYNKIVHNEGEFIITYPYGYHAGFNYGYNLAESVNFALDDWFPIGQITKKCECISDSVGINVRQLICEYNGVPYTEENKEIKEIKENKEIDMVVKKPINDRKRPIQKIEKRKEHHECQLCPNDFSELKASNSSLFQLLSTGSGHVHRICASLFNNQLKIENDHVSGLESITKSQRKLNCTVCSRSRKKDVNGACYQCTHPKCTRAFHGTCGLTDGVLHDFDNITFLCKFHRPKAPTDVETKLAHTKRDSWIQFTFNGNHFFGLVLKNNVSENSMNISVYPNLGECLEIPYESIMIGSPSKLLDTNEQVVKRARIQRKSDSAVTYKTRSLFDGNYVSLPTKKEVSPSIDHPSRNPPSHIYSAATSTYPPIQPAPPMQTFYQPQFAYPPPPLQGFQNQQAPQTIQAPHTAQAPHTIHAPHTAQAPHTIQAPQNYPQRFQNQPQYQVPHGYQPYQPPPPIHSQDPRLQYSQYGHYNLPPVQQPPMVPTQFPPLGTFHTFKLVQEKAKTDKN